MRDDIFKITSNSSMYSTRGNSISNICNPLYNKYIPAVIIYSWVVGSKRFLTWKNDISRQEEYKNLVCPNSIKRILHSFASPYSYIFRTNDEATNYLIGSNSIFRRERHVHSIPETVTPCLLLVYSTEKMLSVFSSEKFLHYDPSWSSSDPVYDTMSSEEVLSNCTLLVSKEFMEHEDSKSIYRRLNKEYIPQLQEKGVEVLVTTSQEMEKNTFSSSTLFIKSPKEKEDFIVQMLEDKFEVTGLVSTETDPDSIPLPF